MGCSKVHLGFSVKYEKSEKTFWTAQYYANINYDHYNV